MLTEADRALLDTASDLAQVPASQRSAFVANRHGNETRFWQSVNALLGIPEAAAYAPTTVAWLRRRRDTGRRASRIHAPA